MDKLILIEYSRIIAEFHGNIEYKDDFVKNEIRLFKFHKSWDWLLPVYKKISDVIYLNENKFEKFEWNRLQSARYMIEHDLLNFEIEKVFTGVAELIKLFKLLLEIKK